MNTRRSPRNQERLWRALAGVTPKHDKAIINMVYRTVDGMQHLSCGHTVALPPCWTGRLPNQRRCFKCEKVQS
jgi:hypothetical protein